MQDPAESAPNSIRFAVPLRLRYELDDEVGHQVGVSGIHVGGAG